MQDELFSVKDQVVIVSGGSRGIGRAIATGFAHRGAKVVITGRDLETLQHAAKEISAQPATVQPISCDVADSDSIRKLVETVLDQHGHIDTLVNVAGVNKRMPAIEYSEEEYDWIIDINLKGAFMLSQIVGKHMIERESGCQVNISSINNERPLKNVLPYAVSKAGLGQMTRALALEWGAFGVRVNAIAPGFILTELTKKLWSREDMLAWGQANTPLKRMGVPHDLIGTAIFLASNAAAFLTGQIIYVDGGFTAGYAWPIDG